MNKINDVKSIIPEKYRDKKIEIKVTLKAKMPNHFSGKFRSIIFIRKISQFQRNLHFLEAFYIKNHLVNVLIYMPENVLSKDDQEGIYHLMRRGSYDELIHHRIEDL